jgi:hypothetical protein
MRFPLQELLIPPSAEWCRINTAAADKLLSSLQSSFNRQRRPWDDVIFYMHEPISNVNSNPLQW